jgi:hypothetical protein
VRAQLYRHFDAAGELLYVGCTGNVIRRTEQHEAQSPWLPEVATITVEHFASGSEALAAEEAAIRAENPKYNVRGKLPDLRQTAEEREAWNAMALSEDRLRAADLLAAHPGKSYFDNSDLAKAHLTIRVPLLQSGLIRKRKFGGRVVYSREDIEALANAPADTWVIPAARIGRAA